jgi:hypothetical protein
MAAAWGSSLCSKVSLSVHCESGLTQNLERRGRLPWKELWEGALNLQYKTAQDTQYDVERYLALLARYLSLELGPS